MKLLIRNGPSSPNTERNPIYRGTDRAHPTYWNALPEGNEINKLFFWFLEEGGESGIVHDINKAIRYVELLNSYSHNKLFDLLEVIEGDVPTRFTEQFIGFDLSLNCNTSLLQWGLKTFSALQGLSEPIQELCQLLSRHYSPQLNMYGLFQTHEIAESCLRSMIALQSLSPNLYEGGNLNRFSIVGLILL